MACTLIAWTVGFLFRITALRLNLQEPEPWHQEQFHQSQGVSPESTVSPVVPAT